MRELILVVEDEETLRRNLIRFLEQQGRTVIGCSTVADAKEAIDAHEVAVALIDLRLPDGDGQSLVSHLLARSPDTGVIVMTAYSSVESVVEALHLGVQDYVVKPVLLKEVARKVDKLCEHLRLLRENARLRRQLAEQHESPICVARSRVMIDLIDFVRQIAVSSSTVLIEGESGSGKDVIARVLHEASPRREGPFAAVNVTAIPDGLIESHLFGHEKGAFSGADASREGMFRAAAGGTLLLDEIGELGLANQAKLLRALETKEVHPVGSDRPVKVDVRIVVATNADLMRLVQEKRFRSDLYYRLSAIRVRVPPLRERIDDIPALAHHFLQKHASEHNRPIIGFDNAALRRLMAYPWPGNVRELSNVVERATVVATGKLVTIVDLPPEVAGSTVPETSNYHGAMADFERALIASTLERCDGDRRKAAVALGMSLPTLYRRIERLGLKEGREQGDAA